VPKLYHIPIGEKMPEIVNTVVECPKSSTNKYKFSKEVGLLKLDRVFHSSACYPGNYGFIPQTLGEDGNPIDILILSPFALTYQCVVEVRVVALLSLSDEKGPDSKIIAVPVKEPRTEEIVDLATIPAHVRNEIQNFFLSYKDLEDRSSFVRVRGWEDKPAALIKIKQGHELFYLFGQRMDAAEDKVNELELENRKLKAQLSCMNDDFERRLAVLETKGGK
jgi:inorganic pyrophosphatase